VLLQRRADFIEDRWIVNGRRRGPRVVVGDFLD
jgi:hypothetical protein